MTRKQTKSTPTNEGMTSSTNEIELQICATTFANPFIKKIIDSEDKTHSTTLLKDSRVSKIVESGKLKYTCVLERESKDRYDRKFVHKEYVSLLLFHTPYTRGMKVYDRMFVEVSHNNCQIAKLMIQEKDFKEVPRIMNDGVKLFNTTVTKVEKQIADQIAKEKQQQKADEEKRKSIAKILGLKKVTKIVDDHYERQINGISKKGDKVTVYMNDDYGGDMRVSIKITTPKSFKREDVSLETLVQFGKGRF